MRFAPSQPAPDDLLAAIDETVEDLLRRAGLAAPPVDAVEVMQRLGLGLLPGRRGRLHARRRGGGSLAPGTERGLFEQQRFAASAIGQRLAAKIFRRARLVVEAPVLQARTRLGVLFATRLLLPTRWFREDVRRFGYDLAELHARYATATIESAAWRLLDLENPAVVTIFDNNHLVERRANVSIGSGTIPLAEAELAAQTYSHAFSRPRIEYSPGLTARAWPLHRADWRREIVVCVLDSELSDLTD